jgi:hypothetical protein
VAFAQNSNLCATVRPGAAGVRLANLSSWFLRRGGWGLSGLVLESKRNSSGLRLHVIKHGGFERGRTNPASLETVRRSKRCAPPVFEVRK